MTSLSVGLTVGCYSATQDAVSISCIHLVSCML